MRKVRDTIFLEGRKMNPQSLTYANFVTSIRYFATMGISYASGRGWISADTATSLIPLTLVIIPYIWSLYSNSAAVRAADVREVQGVRAGVAMAADPAVATPPAPAIGPVEAKSIVAAYAPT